MKHEMNNMEFKRKLPIPKEIKEAFPLSPSLEKIKEARAGEIENIFCGRSDKFLIIVGPCSADNKESVLEYLSKLKCLEEKVSDKLFIIPRLYTNKPRTSGDGYMGMLHQPNADGKPDLLKGILAIRDINISAISQYGFTCADEMLYPENHRYLSDLLAYVTVGARSVENQQHRLTASGLDIPVGMKNPISGDLKVMLNSINSAMHPHTFLYRGWEVHTKGNPFSHGVLRGYTDSSGNYRPNYRLEDLQRLREVYDIFDIAYPSVIVDANHANSGKDYLKQIEVVSDVIKSRRLDREIGKMVKGIMIESYLVDGAQHIGSNVYGQSITDPCLGWEKTEKLLLNIASEI